MSRTGSPHQPGAVTADALPATHTKSIYAADMSPARPLSAERRALVAASRRAVVVGSSERTSFGVLRCTVEGGTLVVSLTHQGKVVGRRLRLRPADPALLQDGARIPELAFAVEIEEFIGTPWHELSSVSIWTVHGLRTKGAMELSIDT